MDRYVVREPRAGATYPQGNQNNMMPFSSNTGRNNIMSPESIYYAPSSSPNVPQPNYIEPVQMNPSFYGQNMMPPQQVTGIDTRYLANYCDNSAQYIVTGQQAMSPPNLAPMNVMNADFGAYRNDFFTGANRNKMTRPVNTNIPHTIHLEVPRAEIIPEVKTSNTKFQQKQNNIQMDQFTPNQVPGKATASVNFNTTGTTETPKKEKENLIMSKTDIIKELQKSGPRAFSGPIEKVLKWHKALQEIGVFVFYEIVAKCVSIRPGESCSKNLVVRDENGPAMQIVYYEIDFLLPEIKIPSTVRIIGRMMPGTCRLQAFSVRQATGDDVAILPRRAAVAAHHVARLFKEFGIKN